MTFTPSRPTLLVGIDPSLTGTAVSSGLRTHATFKPKMKGDFRLQEIHDRLGEWLDAYTPELVVMEDLPTHAHSAGILGMVQGIARLLLIECQVEYVLVTPATLKTFATGKGNSPKPELRMHLYKRTGIDVPDDNAVDAIWLWLLGQHLCGTPQLDLPQTHLRALEKVRR